MKITRTSMQSGIERTIDIDVTQEQIDAWKAGALIQDAMPTVSPEDREFLKTGITPEEWDEMWPEEENEDAEP